MINCAESSAVQMYYAKYGRIILHKTEKMLGNYSIAQEILQETFLKLFQTRPQFNHERALFCWLYKTSQSAAIDYLRSAAYRREHGDSLSIELNAMGEDMELKIADRQVVLKMLINVPEDEAEIFLYRYHDEMTLEEIAEVLDISRKTVERKIEKLKNRLDRKKEGLSW